MPLTNAGRDVLATAINGDSYTAFNAANAYLGVGDSSTAFDATQTDLQASSNKSRKAMNASYPSRSENVITYQSTWDTSSGNWAWNEWGVFNASSGGTMFSRKVESLGTKANTQSWQLTATITVTAA